MNMLFILMILSLIFLSCGVYVFFWAVRARQFKELEVQAYSILDNDEFEAVDPDPESKFESDSDSTKPVKNTLE